MFVRVPLVHPCTLGQGFVSYTLASSMKIRFRTECVIQRFKHFLVLVVYGIHCFKALCFAFIKRVRKIANSDCWLRHACPSFHPSAWSNCVPTGQIFMKFDISLFLENVAVSLKSDKNNGYYT